MKRCFSLGGVFLFSTVAAVFGQNGVVPCTNSNGSTASCTSVPLQSYARNNSFVNFESAHVHPLDITPDGKLLAVNTANNSLEVFTANGETLTFSKSIPVGLDPVSVRARTSSEAWVVNVISDSVSIVDLTNGIVTQTLQTKDEPADVVFAAGSAYVSCAAAKTLLKFSVASPSAAPKSIVIAGEQARALAVDTTGRYVYLAVFESGNGTTIVPGGIANGQEPDVVRDRRGPYGGVNAPPNAGKGFNPPLNPANPAPIPVSIIVKRTMIGSAIQWLDDNLKDWSAFITGAFSQNGTANAHARGWDLIDRDVAIIDTANNDSVTYEGGLMNILMAVGVNPSTNAVTVVGTDATNQIRYEPVLQGAFTRVKIATFTQSNGLPASASVADLNPHIVSYGNHVTAPDLKTNFAAGTNSGNSIGDPRGIAWDAAGLAYITGMGSNNVVVLNKNGLRVGQLNVGQGPTGIVVSNGFAYVLNKFDGTISAFSTGSFAASADASSNSFAITSAGTAGLTTTPLYFDPTPAVIKAGRPILYNTHLTSALGQLACASCHVDARWDRLAWDLGNPAGAMNTLPGVSTNSGNPVTFHPMKGPLLTQTLVDDMQSPSLHWRGDRPVLEDFQGAFNSLMGGPLATQQQINELRSFLATITLPPNPNRNLDNSFSTALSVLGPGNAVIRTGNAAAGAQEFEAQCRSCHPGHTNRGAAYIDTAQAFGVGIRNPPTWKNFYKRTGLWFDSPTGSTAGFGFQQDGTFDSSHNNTRTDNMMAFMMSMNGGYPYEPAGLNETNWSNNSHAAIGKQVTLSPANPTDKSGLLTQLEALADTGVIGLVAKGGPVAPVNGVYTRRGYMYLGNGIWQSDKQGERTTTFFLNASIANGYTLTFTAVHNESAARIGIDMDGDGILDGDDSQPNFPNVTPVNLAPNGTATAVSVLDPQHTAAQAIDNNTLGYFDKNTMLHTLGGNNDWFQEDLGVNAQISLIQLFNRWDCCANRLANVSVFVSEAPFVSNDVNLTRAQPGVQEFFLSGVQGALAQIPMQTAGRYIRVQLNATATPLQLAEVRVMGYKIANFTNPGTQTLKLGQAVNLTPVLNNPTNGATYTYSATGLPPGLTINASNGAITGSVASAAGSYTTTITASGGPGAGSPSTTFVWQGVSMPISLAANVNVYSSFGDGSKPTNGGLDGNGNSYSSTLLGTSVAWNGATFQLGKSGIANAVSGGTVSLPAGSYSAIHLLATAVNGNQANQTFVVTYTDGSTASFVQSLSDWFTPQNKAGESVALSTAHRIMPSGANQAGPWNIYGYSFTLNSQKTVKSITLPNNRNVVVLAMSL